jgi:4-amino-4-deoxy-L-arabinose transferase-like glycosyltransferase
LPKLLPPCSPRPSPPECLAAKVDCPTAANWSQSSLFGLLQRRERWAIGTIFGIGLVLRLVALGTFPGTVTADELDFAGDAISILKGQGPSFFGLDWTPEPALSVHLISWSWRLFGPTIFAERLISALLTAAAIVPFYALVRRVVAVPAALAATLLFASSWWFLHFSRSGWNNGHVVLYMLIAAWALARALERQRWRDWTGSGAALALVLYGYFSGRAVVLAFLAYLAFALWWHWRGTAQGGWRRPLMGALMAGGVCLLLTLPIIFTALNNLPNFTNRTKDVFILNAPREPGQAAAGVLARQTWLTIRSFVLMDTTTGEGRYKGSGMSWLDPLSTALYLVGLLLAVRRGRATCLWWCLLIIPIGLTQILTTGIPDGARGLNAVAPMYFFAALALDAIVARRWLRSTLSQVALVGVIALFAILNVRTYVNWMNTPEAILARAPSIPVAEFSRWHDFQARRLEAHEGLLGTDDYNALSPAVIATKIAEPPPGVAAPPKEYVAPETATIGGPGDGMGQLVAPRAVAVDEQGNIYVADSGRGKIVRYAPDGTFLTEWGDPEQLGLPAAVVVAPDATILALDGETGRITRYDQQGTFLGLIAKVDGPARGMALGRDGRLYIAYTSGDRIIVIPGTGPWLEIDLAAPTPPYNQPIAAIATADGTFFVYEPVREHLLGYSADGQLRFTLDAPGIDTLNAGGMTLYHDNRLLLADPVNRRILVYRTDGILLGSFAVAGKPQGISITPSGLVVVTDTGGQCIRLYDLGDN